MDLKGNDADELRKWEDAYRLRKQICGCQGEGIARGFGKVMYTLLCLRWISRKTSHVELCSVLCASLAGRRIWGRMDACLCMAESLRCSLGTATALLIGYTSMQNVFGVKK